MGLRVLIVDDESLARTRLRALLAECRLPPGTEVLEAEHANAALEILARDQIDALLLDVHMPGMDGMALAQRLRTLSLVPAVVFVTAYPEHALQAFELEALDYLTKPVRRERLQLALDKVLRWQQVRAAEGAAATGFLVIHDRGRTERVPLADVVYLKAELKYVTVRTPQRSWIYDGSLQELEQAHPELWLRIHRNALVARKRLRALERGHDQTAEIGEHDNWVLQLDGVDERLGVSRRQLAVVREALASG